MGTRSGALLEQTIEKIFRNAGFKTKRNIFLKGYEVDVVAESNGNLIVVQCKQHEKSPIVVRDVIHQWESKNKNILADKVVVVIFGQHLTKKDYDLAKKFRVVLWGGDEIDHYEELVFKKEGGVKRTILKDFGLASDNIENKFVKLFISKQKIANKLKGKSKIKVWKTKIDYTPHLLIKCRVDFSEEDFKIKKEFQYFVNLNKNELEFLDTKINREQLLDTREQGSNLKEKNLKINKVEEKCLSDGAKKSKGNYFFSTLKNKYGDLKGIYKKDKNQVFDVVRECFEENIEEEIENAQERYEPKTENFEEDISDLNQDISHLESEKRSLKSFGFFGFKGETDSEKRRNKQRYHNLEQKQSRKQLKIGQLNSKINLNKKRLKETINSINKRYTKIISNSIKNKLFSPQSHDALIIERQIIWLPQLTGEFITDKGFKVPIDITWDKIIKIGECSVCKKGFNGLNNLKFCKICGKSFCSTHYKTCDVCKNVICFKDSWKCPICDGIYCKNEKKFVCNFCKRKVCKECIEKCVICNKFFCRDHLKKCQNCKKFVCQKDSKKCNVCKKMTCKDCLSKCQGCKKNVCKRDFVKCHHCGKRICKNCVRYKRKLLIIKKKRCVFCINKK